MVPTVDQAEARAAQYFAADPAATSLQVVATCAFFDRGNGAGVYSMRAVRLDGKVHANRTRLYAANLDDYRDAGIKVCKQCARQVPKVWTVLDADGSCGTCAGAGR